MDPSKANQDVDPGHETARGLGGQLVETEPVALICWVLAILAVWGAIVWAAINLVPQG